VMPELNDEENRKALFLANEHIATPKLQNC
jgi:hypothetical protein